MYLKLLEKLVKNGVATPTDLKNVRSELRKLVRRGWVDKKIRSGKVYYELTGRSVPFLNNYRRMLLHEVQMEAQMVPQNQQIKALLGDLRFLDPHSKTAKKYKFLGDWQLRHPVLPNHLKLAHLQYYEREEA